MEQTTLPFDLPVALITPDEIYPDAEGLLNLLNENRFYRKSSRIQPRTLGESFSMWANTLPEGGLIAVGIENDSSMGDIALSVRQN
jgi:ATP-dependent DNA helicase RecG